MGRPHRAKSGFNKCKEFLHPMAELKARQLKLAGEVAHIFAGGGEEIDAALGQACWL